MKTNLFNSGTVGCLWYIAWVLIVREGPEKDKCVSKDELRYIQDSLGSKQHTRIKHPWKEIFTSKAVYAISASHFAENWGFYTMLTQLPTFLAGILLFLDTQFVKSLTICPISIIIDTLGYKLEKAGFLAAAPYLVMGVLLTISGYVADLLQVKGYLTTTQVRRYFNCGG